MRRLRCPRCQAINYEGHITYPICHKCHENLLKCCYCRNFPGQEGRCRYLPEWSLAGGDLIVECDYRDSKLHVGMPRLHWRGQSLRSLMALSMIVCSVIALLVTVIPMLSEPREHKHSFLFTSYIPRQTWLGQRVTMRFTVFNENPAYREDIRIRLNDRLFRHFQLEHISPAMVHLPTQRTGHYYLFHGLKPSERIDARFQMRAIKPGKTKCQVTLYCGEGEPLHSYTRVITVQDARSIPYHGK